jgi:hypothetical protein
MAAWRPRIDRANRNRFPFIFESQI